MNQTQILKKLFYSAVVLGCLSLPVAGAVSHFKVALVPQIPDLLRATTAPPESRTVFVHLFEWQWDDIAQECEQFLGPNGFAAVQISPPNEHVVLPERGYPWWQRYQPVSYQLQSRSGDRQQFAAMVSRCQAAGVKIYADAVINHMSALPSGTGSAGSDFSKYRYPGLYEPEDFHSCQKEITDYNNHSMVTKCELVGLPDLKTSSDHVQQQIANYLLDLLSLGVSGFRIDAAKHIHTDDLGGILERVNVQAQVKPEILQEVIDPGTEAVSKTEYYRHGQVYEFEYGRKVGEKFLGINGQTLSQLETLDESWGLAPSAKAIVFIDNHDKQRGHGGGGTYVTHQEGDLYDLANLFMLAWPYGYPQLMSSYAFSDSDQGPPADANGQTQPVYHNGQTSCFQDWQCEHRRPAIVGMVAFRNAVLPEAPVTNWWSNGGNQIAFSRGSQGFVMINREATALTHTFQTSLPAGAYCNSLQGGMTGDRSSCNGSTITVNPEGEATLTVPRMAAIAIHIGQKLPESQP